MSKEYEIECDGFNYFVEAEPVIEDESVDHEFGLQKVIACTDVKIESVCRGDTIISDKVFRADEDAFEELLKRVSEDWAGGYFG